MAAGDVARRSDFGTLERAAKQKLSNDNDIKIIIQADNSQTGIGKTTLAIQLCRAIDPEWSAKERSFLDVREYLNAHLNAPEGSALLLDEIEHGADSRRSMSQENVDLSQGWAKLRARNIATVATLPSISMLDNRMLELADYWVLVKSRGVAQPYKINVNNFNHKIQRKPLPGEEHIRFADLPEDDPDKKYLDQIKDDAVESAGIKSLRIDEHEKRVAEEIETAKREYRNEWIRELRAQTDLGPSEIAELDVVDVSASQVSRVASEGE